MTKFVKILVAAMLLVSLLAGCGKSSQFGSLASKAQAFENGDYSKLEEMCPAAYWEYMEDEYDFDIDDRIDSMEESFEEYSAEDYEETYGKNWKVTLSAENEKKLDKDTVEDIAKCLEEYGIDEKDVTAAYKVWVKRTVKGDDDKNITMRTYHVVKISGKFYICNVYMEEDDKVESASFYFG